jgi:hypothetical protein
MLSLRCWPTTGARCWALLTSLCICAARGAVAPV